jgi:hypothetical protein
MDAANHERIHCGLRAEDPGDPWVVTSGVMDLPLYLLQLRLGRDRSVRRSIALPPLHWRGQPYQQLQLPHLQNLEQLNRLVLDLMTITTDAADG